MSIHDASRRRLFWNALAVLMLAAFGSRPVVAQTCEKLADLKLANTTITTAQSVAAGSFTRRPVSQRLTKNCPPSVGSLA